MSRLVIECRGYATIVAAIDNGRADETEIYEGESSVVKAAMNAFAERHRFTSFAILNTTESESTHYEQ